ncbi:MAG: class I SAM-dependent methyltransferase [Nocardioides sp.]|nr:class I SAM-dependent methyltransferase [Nocardioides sp.]
MAPSTSAPGSRVVTAGFFDQYPRFYETSETFAYPSRLNLRHEAIFGENRDVFEGRRVLDIASHDGRWSFAALQAGAASVVGIEGRPELVDAANATFAHYDVSPERYRFIADDIYHALAEEPWEFDVVMCLGFLYHTLRYNELMARIRRCNPTHLIIDTEVATDDRALVHIRVEDIGPQRNAVADDFSHEGRVLSGRPSVKGLETIVGAYGFEVERYSDWAGLVRDNPENADEFKNYRRGRRVTLRCKAQD